MPRTYRLRSRPAPSGQKTDFAALLNEQQLAAVTSPIGASLVIAGAGSGKTRTLTHRVAYLIEEGMPARNILLLTFTNKAAREMLDRVEEIITLDRLSLWGGTFHSIGNRILRRHADLIGYRKNFSIMDREDQRSLLLQAFKESGLPERVLKDKRFPKAKVLADIFSMAENLACDLEEILEARYDHLAEHWEEIGTVRTAYEKKKLATNVMDFDDLLTKTLNLLEENAAICEGYQNQFRAILVDEYQDTNPVQSRLIDLLAQKHGHLMVVGDDAQSIYSWRGADFRNILGFSDRYPDAKTYKIETNYRSVPEVLTLANEVISQNEEQFPKELQPARESADNLPVLVPVEDPNFQAQFISQRIEDFQAEGVELNEIAILYRAHFHSMEIQMALTRLGLPYRITSGVRFFEQAHLKDVCSFIRFTVNPRDEVAFQRMVKLIPGIGDITADKLWQAWLGCGASTEEEPPESYSKLLEGFRVPKTSVEGWKQLGYTLDELVEDRELVKPGAMIDSILGGVYDDYMKTEFSNYERRHQDLEQFNAFSRTFDSAEELLSELSLMSNVDTGDEKRAANEEEESIVLSTIHQAKGLEWKVVFVIWMTEGMFPHGRVLRDADSYEEAEDGLEEERRLFYVAVTRAMDHLYLTYPETWPTSHSNPFQMPSRFITELPDGLLDEWRLS